MITKGSIPQVNAKPVVPVILFGTDDRGKPKAARFSDKHAEIATKAAEQLSLRVLKVLGRPIEDLAARLPQGRIHANGRGFVPYVKRDLYDKLAAAAAAPPVPSPAPAVIAATGHRLDFPTSGKEPGRPSDWDKIAVGHSVIALEEPGWGWYEAIVDEIHGDMLTLRWRYYPTERRVTRHRLSVGLLYPGSELAATLGAKPADDAKPKEKAANSAESDKPPSAFPRSWDKIDLNSLVLAEEDGPWRTWWQAVPVTKTDQTLTLKWRDFEMLPHIQRPPVSVALLYPNGH